MPDSGSICNEIVTIIKNNQEKQNEDKYLF